MKCRRRVLYSQVHVVAAQPRHRLGVCGALLAAVKTSAQRAADLEPAIKDFMFVIPKAGSRVEDL